jgi:hypothetical protein
MSETLTFNTNGQWDLLSKSARSYSDVRPEVLHAVMAIKEAIFLAKGRVLIVDNELQKARTKSLLEKIDWSLRDDGNYAGFHEGRLHQLKVTKAENGYKLTHTSFDADTYGDGRVHSEEIFHNEAAARDKAAQMTKKKWFWQS